MPSPDKFFETLHDFRVDERVIDRINEGFGVIGQKMKKSAKAEYFRRALEIMKEELGDAKTHEIFEANACCKSGARDRASKEFRRINASLPIAERLAKIAKAPYMNMGCPELDSDGTLVIHAVNYKIGDRFACACPTISRQVTSKPISGDYCFCCAGHFKYHYEIMLEVKLTVAEIVSSPLDSDGEFPCVIRYNIEKSAESENLCG